MTPAPRPWKFFYVHIRGFPPAFYTAPSRSKARARACADLREAYDEVSWREFLGLSRVLSAEPPQDDGYTYVREHYDLPSFRLGDPVDLKTLGAGVVIYPGVSTHMVTVGLPSGAVLRVHPLDFAERLAAVSAR